MFDVNVMGLLYATDAAIEVMKRQGGGHLVNISSVAGRKVTRDSSGVYAGTKFAVGAISEGLRQELLQDNIRVTIVEPGCRRDRTDDPHHRRGRQREPRRTPRSGDLAGRGHRQRHHLRRHPARAGERERDPDPTHPTARVARSGLRPTLVSTALRALSARSG